MKKYMKPDVAAATLVYTLRYNRTGTTMNPAPRPVMPDINP